MLEQEIREGQARPDGVMEPGGGGGGGGGGGFGDSPESETFCMYNDSFVFVWEQYFIPCCSLACFYMPENICY